MGKEKQQPRLRLVIPISKPTELREKLLKSAENRVRAGSPLDEPLHIRVESEKKKALAALSMRGGVSSSDLVRMLIDSAIACDLNMLGQFLQAGISKPTTKAKVSSGGSKSRKVVQPIEKKRAMKTKYTDKPERSSKPSERRSSPPTDHGGSAR